MKQNNLIVRVQLKIQCYTRLCVFLPLNTEVSGTITYIYSLENQTSFNQIRK